jgi:hypothetical protein
MRVSGAAAPCEHVRKEYEITRGFRTRSGLTYTGINFCARVAQGASMMRTLTNRSAVAAHAADLLADLNLADLNESLAGNRSRGRYTYRRRPTFAQVDTATPTVAVREPLTGGSRNFPARTPSKWWSYVYPP